MTPKPGVLGFAKRPVGTFYHHQPCQRHDAMMFLMLVYNDPDAGNASDVGDVATAVSRSQSAYWGVVFTKVLILPNRLKRT